MAVIQGGGGGGLLSTLGPIATLAGAVIPGAPGWLTAAGLGASALGSAMNGNLTGSLGQILNGLAGIFTPMQNPGATGAEAASATGAQTAQAPTQASAANDPYYDLLNRRWGGRY